MNEEQKGDPVEAFFDFLGNGKEESPVRRILSSEQHVSNDRFFSPLPQLGVVDFILNG